MSQPQENKMSKKNYVVVGGSRGIGLGIVQRLTARGGSVTVLSRTPGAWDDQADVRHVSVDVVRDAVTAEMMPESIDGLVYCPGSISLGPLRSVKPDQLSEDFQLNVVGGMQCVQAALAAMKAAGNASVVMFSTV